MWRAARGYSNRANSVQCLDPSDGRDVFGGLPVMLKGISPLLNADVLYALKAMGHGDMLVIVDTNFPADAIARLAGNDLFR